MPEGCRVLSHGRKHDVSVGPKLGGCKLQREALVRDGRKDDLPVSEQRPRDVPQHPAVPPHGRERHGAIDAQRPPRAEQRPAGARVHGREDEVPVGLELLRRVLQRTAIGAHSGGHDLAIGPEGVVNVLQHVAVLLHSSNHNLSIALQVSGGMLDGRGIAGQRCHDHLAISSQLLAKAGEGGAPLPKLLQQARTLDVHPEERDLGFAARHGLAEHLAVLQRPAAEEEALCGGVQALEGRHLPLN
mmetsp:Transcript_57305/g.177878  ORF Transcript_57305/g.177878 Transcript_57305/m.177878 type:complete len:244 (-) Transcript_57305:124-855(-)